MILPPTQLATRIAMPRHVDPEPHPVALAAGIAVFLGLAAALLYALASFVAP